MQIDVLVAEIGSTTTVVNAFDDIAGPNPVFVGQGQAPTSVSLGDVNIGLNAAISDLKERLSLDSLSFKEMLATSSAAGGLRMTVHGLVYDMTVKAAKEAALGAGANIKFITAGKLRRTDLQKIDSIKPNIILIAGGVDYGERNTAILNAELIASLNLDIPVIYAGNIENHDEIKLIFEGTNYELFIVDNVYPKIDELNIEPTRRIIQDAFEKHIIHAPGMSKVKELITGPIIPTPGAVMEASILLKESVGNLIVFDVGGATTDLHSVTDDSEEVGRLLISPEPKAKRTVEGDLGVYVNVSNIINLIGEDVLRAKHSNFDALFAEYKPIPFTNEEKSLVEDLTLKAVLVAIERHAGGYRHLYGPSGKITVAEGKDLTNVRWIIGTGGALTRLPGKKDILKAIAPANNGLKLYPQKEAEILIDEDYIMASLGVLSKVHPEASLALLKKSIGMEG